MARTSGKKDKTQAKAVLGKGKSKITPIQRVPRPDLSKLDVNQSGSATYGNARYKFKQHYTTAENITKRKVAVKRGKPKLRPSITPGTVLIILVGRFKGKRVVFLKQLGTGLLLVSGPFILNQVPLKRINQRYVIATSTKVDLSGVEVPAKINDKYFKNKPVKTTKEKGDIFRRTDWLKTITDEKKAEQKAVDLQLIKAMRESSEGKLLMGYLKTKFFLSNNQCPHNMVF